MSIINIIYFLVNENAQDTKPVSALLGVVKDISMIKGHTNIGRGRMTRPINTQSTEVHD